MANTNSSQDNGKQNIHINFLNSTFHFFRKHFLVIMGLGLISAIGRVIQLGGFGPVSSKMYFALEVAIESARIFLVCYVLGMASVRDGIYRIKHFFTQRRNRKHLWSNTKQQTRVHWRAIIVNLTGFALLAWGMNYLINALAYQTCFYLMLKKEGILAAASSEWTILLFFKNISVIPFTLIFETIFLLWLTNRLKTDKEINR